MKRQEAKEFYLILQAYAKGKVIECRTDPSTLKEKDTPNEWTEMKEIEYWDNVEYRIKPEPKYRPFNNAEECWQEMQKHKPFGWIKASHGQFLITGLRKDEIAFGINDNWQAYNYIFKSYTFADGTPFGIKEE